MGIIAIATNTSNAIDAASSFWPRNPILAIDYSLPATGGGIAVCPGCWAVQFGQHAVAEMRLT